MLQTIILFIGLMTPPKPSCETHTRFDGSSVTVCQGHVVLVSDGRNFRSLLKVGE